MTQLSVHFKRRDFVDSVLWPQVQFSVKRLAWRDEGGPDEAIIEARGPKNALFDLIEMLRCPIEVHEGGEAIWWGYAESALVRVGAIEIGVSLEDMYNRVAVLYSETNISGVVEGTVETSWIQDDTSVGMFGTKERRFSMHEGTATQAAAFAARALAECKYPKAVHQFTGAPAKQFTAQLVCRGWWETAYWQYYANIGAKESYEEIGIGLVTFGKGLTSTTISFDHDSVSEKIKDTTEALMAFSANDIIYVTGSSLNNGTYSVSSVRDDDPGGSHLVVNEAVVDESAGAAITIQVAAKIAQSFQCAAGMTGAATVRLRVKRKGTPTDNLVVAICADNSGAPGTVLASCSTLGSTIDENLKWHEFQLSSRINLTAATTYWIVVDRDGAIDPNNYYKVDANEDLGYTSGVMRLYTGSTWVARSPDADMVFSVGGQSETTEQLDTILDDCEFITAIDMECASGIYSPSYRDGRLTAGEIVEELLETGGPNGRRLHAQIDVNRRCRVYEEPAEGSEDYYLRADGTLSDYLDKPIRVGRWPVGVWAKLKDVIPDSLDLNVVLDARRVYIERVVYETGTGIVRFTPRTRKLLDVE